MRLTRDNMHVETGEFDERSGNNWYIIRVDIPELDLRSPPIFTAEYGHDLIEMIASLSDECPNCKKVYGGIKA